MKFLEADCNCPICFNDYNSDLIIPVLICANSHYVCNDCYQRIVEQNNKKQICPLCKSNLIKEKVHLAKQAGAIAEQVNKIREQVKSYQNDSSTMKEQQESIQKEVCKLIIGGQKMISKAKQSKEDGKISQLIEQFSRLLIEEREILNSMMRLEAEVQSSKHKFEQQKLSEIEYKNMKTREQIVSIQALNQNIRMFTEIALKESEQLLADNTIRKARISEIEKQKFMKKRMNNPINQVFKEYEEREEKEIDQALWMLCQYNVKRQESLSN